MYRSFLFILFIFLLHAKTFLFSAELTVHDYAQDITSSKQLSIYGRDFPAGIPWLTGPLLSPSGATQVPGTLSFYPYLSTNIIYGEYNSHWKIESIPTLYQATLLFPLSTGILSWLDISIYPQVIANWREGSHDLNVGDMPFQLGFQLFRKKNTFAFPDVKLSLGAIIPFGKYDHLNPNKKGTDIMGIGSWSPAVTLSATQLIQIKTFHYIALNAAARYRIGTPVLVKGFNAYGGTSTTKGYVYPGNILTLFSAVEYNFLEHWAVACDLVYTYQNKTRFSGEVGSVSTTDENMKAPSGELFTLSPAIEYNWSENVGLVTGVWFTVKGRNTLAFTNILISISIYI